MTTTRTNHGSLVPLASTPPAPSTPSCENAQPAPALSEFNLANMDLLAIGHDPETYHAHRIKGREALKFWAWCAYGSLDEADAAHAADMAKNLNDPDCWNCVDGQAVHFETAVGEDGSFHLYLITDS